jgi:glycosyltransferase involved in cell wall biosynthesis
MTSAEDNAGPLRVLITLHQGGGAGSVTSVLALALGLHQHGLRVHLVCPPGSPAERAALDGGLAVHPLPLAAGNRFRNARRLADLLATLPVDMVNSQSSRDREALTWLGLTRRNLPPFVFTRRNYPHTSRFENWLAGRVARRVIAVSEPVADVLAGRGVPRDRIRIVANGLVTARTDRPVAAADVERWKARIGWEEGRRTIGIVARLKDQEVVVRALASVATPVRLVLAGVDPVEARRFPPVPARHAVVAVPYDPDVRPLYDLLEVVLHPSRLEALPQSVLEALALGKPLIASNATGNAVVVRHEVDGLLAAPADPASWAEALTRLLGDAVLARRLGENGRQRARDDFALDRTVAGTLAVYREAVAEARAGRR